MIEDESYEIKQVYKIKEKKSVELAKQNAEFQREITDLKRDCEELVQCKAVLENELSEEEVYQEQMKTMIAKLKRNIYEVKTDRERLFKDISQARKIHNNL